MFERIMVPTDGSVESEQAMPIARQIASAQGAEVLLVQVIQYPVVYDHDTTISGDIYQEMLDAAEDDARANLGRLKAQFEGRGIRATTMFLRGSPAVCLLDTEREQKADLVVMATHGRTGVARFALGSIADRMVREGTSPVLVARSSSLEPTLKTALLMLDGSGVAEEAVPMLEILAHRPIENVKLFRVVDDLSDRTAAATYLGAVGARLEAAGLKAEIVVDIGDPTFLVRRAAQGADLVVLSTHGRGGIDRFRHGSVADRVVREAEKSVLLVRAGMPSRAALETSVSAAAAGRRS
jgi:nucleotide-binding universal stress UspA family protein